MKYLILILLFIQVIQASEWDVYLTEGNKAYSDGNYENAVMHYSKILENDFESGELYFNLGNAYYKLNEIGNSIYYYEKALKFIEGDEALEQNLKIARLKIIDKIDPVPKLFIWVWIDSVIHLLSIEYWGWISWAFFC